MMNASSAVAEIPGCTSLTVEQAMTEVVVRLGCGDLDDAEAICRKILAVAPDYPPSLHYLGMLEHKRGNGVEALALVERSVELAPDHADWHNNQGIVLQARGDWEGALRAFERAIALCPSHAHAHNNRGVLLRVIGRFDDAEDEYRQAIALEPTYADAYGNLAMLLRLQGRTHEAVSAYCTAVTLRPSLPEARRFLVLAYCQIGEFDKARMMCEEWVADSPDDPVAHHALVSITKDNVPDRASDEYIQKTFDGFSRTFEAKLAQLDYRAPELVARALSQTVGRARSLDIVDAGCGTGLCGPLLAPYARRLTGVDLSEGMLEHAAAKPVYDELVQSELTAYLAGRQDAFDAVVSADTLVYFGPIDEVARAAAGALRLGGRFIFTVEEAVGDSAAPYAIQPHGRFCHRADYVERVLRQAGFHTDIQRGELRKEAGSPVPGLVVCATKIDCVTGARRA